MRKSIKICEESNLDKIIEESRLYQEEITMALPHWQSKKSRLALCKNLATAISKLLKERGECTKLDLLMKGFVKSEIERNWPIAYALAKVELNWMDG